MSDAKISIQFLGAAKTVTGSKHLLKTPEGNILIDCGLFQGLKDLRKKNWEPLPVDPSGIKTVLLTHAHLDHCGYLPLLVKAGFKGKIMMTAPTYDLATIILEDSARIQEEDAEQANLHGYSKHKPALPLYTTEDVALTLSHFEIIEPDTWYELSTSITYRYRKNGHILGSCFIEVDCYGKRIVFSGDLGRKNDALLEPPCIPEKADYLIMESTYGDRLHSTRPIEVELSGIINETIHRHGALLIPSFAVGRAQELMFHINELKKKIQIPDVKVYLDTPMGSDATDVLWRHSEWHKLTREQCVEVCNNVIINRDYKNTPSIINSPGSKIVISASGMLTGGRVLNYLEHYLLDKKDTILLAGYQAMGTRGRALKEGTPELKIHGKFYKVKCHVTEVSSLSAHADQKEMIEWIAAFKQKPGKILLVHGEPQAQDTFRVKLQYELNVEVNIPSQDEEIIL